MNELASTPVVWQAPPPRRGLLGQWDEFIGPGATRHELLLIWLAGIGGVAGAVLYAWTREMHWSAIQWAVAVLTALDLFAGVVANATSTTKRWYHRPGRTSRHHLLFAAAHLYPFLIAWIFRSGDWLYAVLVYGYMLTAAGLIVQAPVYLKRPLAMLLFLAGLAIPWLLLAPTPGLHWFVPVLYLKILVCHLVPETPYRPTTGEEH